MNYSFREKVMDTGKRLVIYEVVPPEPHTTVKALKRSASMLSKILQDFHDVDAIYVPEVIEENDRGSAIVRHQKCGCGVTAAVTEKKSAEVGPEIKPADQITSVDVSIGDFATIYGKCKAAVEDIYGTKALMQEHIAAVNTLFIQVSKDKYFKEKNSE